MLAAEKEKNRRRAEFWGSQWKQHKDHVFAQSLSQPKGSDVGEIAKIVDKIFCLWDILHPDNVRTAYMSPIIPGGGDQVKLHLDTILSLLPETLQQWIKKAPLPSELAHEHSKLEDATITSWLHRDLIYFLIMMQRYTKSESDGVPSDCWFSRSILADINESCDQSCTIAYKCSVISKF